MSAATYTIADAIRDECRNLAGIYRMTLEELAEKAGVRPEAFNDPNVNELKALCDVFGVLPSQMVKFAESERWRQR